MDPLWWAPCLTCKNHTKLDSPVSRLSGKFIYYVHKNFISLARGCLLIPIRNKRVCLLLSPHPILIFVGKERSLPLVWNLTRGFIRVGSILACILYTSVELTDSVKNSSLLRIDYSRSAGSRRLPNSLKHLVFLTKNVEGHIHFRVPNTLAYFELQRKKSFTTLG